jgi:hypothetical protein
MFLKKVGSKNANDIAGDREISVVIEPMQGHSDHEIVRSLERTGASEIKVLAPGHISALINPAAFKMLESIAYVHPKQKHIIRAGF